jgi:hypothetical protein
MHIEFSKAGALYTQSGDAGRISSSKGASELNFRDITKELAKKIEPVKTLLQSVGNDLKPVIISFPEANAQRSAYIMVSNFSKFPDENRNYDRTEYYVGKNELASWLDYFTNKYQPEPVQVKNYEENPVTINEVKITLKNIDGIVAAFAKGSEIIKLSQNDSLEILASLPPIYHQFISFAINANEQICQQLNIIISIEGNSSNLSTSNNLDLNNETLLKFLNEYVKFKPCNSLSELAKLHIQLAKECKDTEFNLDKKSNLLALFKNGNDLRLKEDLLRKLIDVNNFGANFTILSDYYNNILASNTIKQILSDFEKQLEEKFTKLNHKENRPNDTTKLKKYLISSLGYTEKSPEFIKSIYQKQVLNIAISVVNIHIGISPKHLADILNILKKANSNLIDENLLNETIEGLEKLKDLKIETSPSKKKNNQVIPSKSSHFKYIDDYANTLLKHKPANEIFQMFLYLFSVPTAIKLLNNISNENIKKYNNEIVNWLNTNNSNYITNNIEYKALQANKNYEFYFYSDEKIQEEKDRKIRKNEELILLLEQNIQTCDNKFVIQKLKSEEFKLILETLNQPENLEKLKQNKNLKYNIKLGSAFEKYFDSYQTRHTSLFNFIDNKYPNKKNRFVITMKNFKNFRTANKIVMTIGVVFFILGVGALFSALNPWQEKPSDVTEIITVPTKDSIVYSSKQIGTTTFNFVKKDQTINLKTFCTDSSINNLLKKNFSKLKINDSTNAHIFFSMKNKNMFMIFFKDASSNYLVNYLEFEKATAWKVKIADGKPSIYSGHDFVNGMKTIPVIMEP